MLNKIIHFVRKKIRLQNEKNILKKQFEELINLSKNTSIRFNLNSDNIKLCFNDKSLTTNFDPHYLYHTAWAARILAKIKPSKHVDISSKLEFGAFVSAFIPFEFYDFRPALIYLNNYKSTFANLLNLDFKTNSIESLSCMHTIEHIGLGRYGDQLDYDGDLKAISELKRVLAIGGNLLFVVPIGKPKIMFNAHRIYSYKQIIEYFSTLTLIEFSLIPDNGHEVGIINNCSEQLANEQNYGCGCFWFKK